MAVAHDGALLVSDDGGNLIWRVAYAKMGAGSRRWRPPWRVAAGAAAQTAAMPPGARTVYDDRCSGCHVIDGVGQGPNLAAWSAARPVRSPGFDYTPALKASGLTWTAANLDRWLVGPQKLVPGTAMTATVPDPANAATSSPTWRR